MPPALRRDVPDDAEFPVPTPAPSRRTADPPPPPRPSAANGSDPADFPLAMAIGRLLTVVAAVAGSLTILLLLLAFTVRQPEGTTTFFAAFFSLPLIAVTTLSTGVGTAVYVRCGARRRAIVLGVATVASVVTVCAVLGGFF
jgi:uncharacterized integral membrane protein